MPKPHKGDSGDDRHQRPQEDIHVQVGLAKPESCLRQTDASPCKQSIVLWVTGTMEEEQGTKKAKKEI